MKISIKKPEDIAILREGGKRLARVMQAVCAYATVGMTTLELDMYAHKLITEEGDTPSFLHYTPEGMGIAYPRSICVSVNSEIVHGIPSAKKKLKDGDVVSIDIGLRHGGLFTDHACTIVVGKSNKKKGELLAVTKECLMAGIAHARAGMRTGDIGHAIAAYVKPHGYGIVRELSGHGVGYAIHEDPYIPNYGRKGTGEVLRAGMVIAIEPMLTLGSPDIIERADGYTIATADGSLAAHFEHTILITDAEPEILTMV
jgi:methionyl aminopeptidase